MWSKSACRGKNKIAKKVRGHSFEQLLFLAKVLKDSATHSPKPKPNPKNQNECKFNGENGFPPPALWAYEEVNG